MIKLLLKVNAWIVRNIQKLKRVKNCKNKSDNNIGIKQKF